MYGEFTEWHFTCSYYFFLCVVDVYFLRITIINASSPTNKIISYMCVIKLMENNAWQNLYRIPYLSETAISAWGLKVRGLYRYLSRVVMGSDTDFDLYCCFYNTLKTYLVSISCVKLILIYCIFPILEVAYFLCLNVLWCHLYWNIHVVTWKFKLQIGTEKQNKVTQN